MIDAPPPPKTTIQAEPELGGRAAFAWQFGAVEHYAAWTVQWGEPICVNPLDDDERVKPSSFFDIEPPKPVSAPEPAPSSRAHRTLSAPG